MIPTSSAGARRSGARSFRHEPGWPGVRPAPAGQGRDEMDAKRQKLTEWRRATLVRPLETASRRAQNAFQEAKGRESRCTAALQSQQSQLDHLQTALAAINDPHFDRIW